MCHMLWTRTTVIVAYLFFFNLHVCSEHFKRINNEHPCNRLLVVITSKVLNNRFPFLCYQVCLSISNCQRPVGHLALDSNALSLISEDPCSLLGIYSIEDPCHLLGVYSCRPHPVQHIAGSTKNVEQGAH